jgi:RNA polymerase sigma factor (sigma-70 family)
MTPAERRLESIAITHGPRVLAYLARRTTPVEDAADVYQEVLTTVWRKIHDTPDDPEHRVAWLLSIARRTLANHRRSQARRQSATERLRGELTAYAPGGPATDDEPRSVRAALMTLGEADREVLALTYWEGLTSDQVATVVGASPSTTRKRLQRARERLAAALEGGQPRGPAGAPAGAPATTLA